MVQGVVVGAQVGVARLKVLHLATKSVCQTTLCRAHAIRNGHDGYKVIHDDITLKYLLLRGENLPKPQGGISEAQGVIVPLARKRKHTTLIANGKKAIRQEKKEKKNKLTIMYT